MHERFRTSIVGFVGREIRVEFISDVPRLRRQALAVARAEHLPQALSVKRWTHAGRTRSADPAKLLYLFVAPMRSVQMSRLAHGKPRLFEREALELVALLGRRQILHHE